MFIVFDTLTSKPNYDNWGHIKVYCSKQAARRSASDFNKSVQSKNDRMKVVAVELRLDRVWGQTNYF